MHFDLKNSRMYFGEKTFLHSHSIMFEMQIYIIQNALWLSLWNILNSKKVAVWFFILQFLTGTPGRFLRIGVRASEQPKWEPRYLCVIITDGQHYVSGYKTLSYILYRTFQWTNVICANITAYESNYGWRCDTLLIISFKGRETLSL